MIPRRENRDLAERITLSLDHAALTADTTVKLYKVPTGRTAKLRQAQYVNPTGLVAHADNWFEVAVKNGSTKAAAWSSDAGGVGINGGASEGTIPVDDPVELTFATAGADRVFTAGEVVSAVFDETGTATLPAGRLTVVLDLY